MANMFQLQNIIPQTLRDRPSMMHSGIWGKLVQLNPSECIKITAPSGTGKTTLIHFLYGLRNDYTGHILYQQQSLAQLSGEAIAVWRQQEYSIVFQDLRLFPQLSARENIELNRVLQNPYCLPAAVEEMADELGITHIMQQPVHQCSYGEQQRIAIIRALVQPFNWLLMDEPFSHLDQANTSKAIALIERACKKRNAGMLVTNLDDDCFFNYTSTYHL